MPAQLLLGLILGQAVPAATADAAEMDRIRKALAQPPAIDVTRVADRADKPVFRLTVHGRRFDSSPWENWTLVPSYIRPSYPLYHNEMLMMWTPEAFRSSVLYPGAMTTRSDGSRVPGIHHRGARQATKAELNAGERRKRGRRCTGAAAVCRPRIIAARC